MQDFRPTLLHHVLTLVPFDGWTDYTLREAGRRAGVAQDEVKRAFASPSACIDYYFTQVDEQVKKALPEQTLAAMRVPERIEALLMKRLALMLPNREAVRRAASARLLPANAGSGLTSLFATVDWMWRASGDRSTDFNYYTKRVTLMGVYVSTFLFWLNDESPQMEETYGFLKRRLNGVANFGKKKKELLGKLHSFSYYKKR